MNIEAGKRYRVRDAEAYPHLVGVETVAREHVGDGVRLECPSGATEVEALARALLAAPAPA